MDIRSYEFDSNTGLPIVGAAVTVYTATLTHPPVTVETSGVTDSNGKWEFTGLAAGTKDVKIVANSQTKWYKGKTEHSVAAIFFEGPAQFLQISTPSAPGANGSILYFKADGLPYYRSGAAGAETKIADYASATGVLGSSGWTNSPTVTGTVTAGTSNATQMNVNTTGAAAGEIKTNAAVRSGGSIYFSGSTKLGGRASENGSVASSGTVTIGADVAGSNQALLLLNDTSNGDMALCFIHGGAHAVTEVKSTTFAGLGAWNFGADAGTFWAVYYTGGAFTVKNRTAGARSLQWEVLGWI